jgi:hypothetical protein
MFDEKTCNETECKYCKIPNTESCKTRINDEFYISIDSYELSVLFDRVIEGSKKSKNLIWKFAYMTLSNAILSLRFLIRLYEDSTKGGKQNGC